MFDFLKKKPYFPCKECIVKPACTKACDKLVIDSGVLLNIVKKYNCCPDCGADQFYDGPRGGMSINIKCASCNHEFNNSLPFSFDRINMTLNGWVY